MSAYPPPPPIGGPFSSQPQYPSSSGGGYTPMPHFQYQQGQAFNVQPFSQSSISASPFTNTYSFNANAQGTPPSSASTGMSNTTLPSYIAAQHTSFPPPPFPPIPIPPYGVFPQPSTFLHNSVANTVSAQPPITLPQNPPPPPLPVWPLESKSETPPNAVTAASDLEDGELSDGASSKHTKETTSGHKSSPVPSMRQINEDRRHFRKNQNNNANEGYRSPNGGFSRHSPRNQERLQNHGQTRGRFAPAESSESYNQVRDRRGNARDTDSRWVNAHAVTSTQPSSGAMDSPKVPDEIREPQIMQEGRRQHPLSQDSRSENEVRNNATTLTEERGALKNGYSPSEIEGARRIRNRAKSALQELHPHHIGYTKLVQEGIDSGLLLELYNEMGINVSSPMLRRKVDIAKPQGSASTTFKAGVTGESLSNPDRELLGQARPSSIPTASYINDNINTQNASVLASHDVTIKQKRHEQGSEGVANGQPVQNSQVSEAHLNVSSPKPGPIIRPTLPEKVDLLKEAQSSNSNPKSSTAIAATKNLKVDMTLTSVPAEPLSKSSTNHIGAAKPADKALERKDYIARMLAAKVGKPMPTSNAPAPSTTSAVHEVKAITKAAPPTKTQSAGIPEERRLYLSNLAFTTTEADINSLFGGYSIEEVLIPTIPKGTRPTGYCFVRLSTSTEAQRAISELSGRIVHDQEVSIQLARKSEQVLNTVEVTGKAGTPLIRESSQDNLATQNATIEAKRKAQTDLARQKMEALKSRTISQRQTSLSNSTASSTIQLQPLPYKPPPSALRENVTSGAPVMNPSQNTPNGSYFSPLNERQPFSIPGLFMSPTRPLSMHNNEQPVITNSVTLQESPQAITSVPSSNIDVRSQALSMQSLAGDLSSEKPSFVFTTEATNEPTTRVSKVNEPRKRQKAADFIDSPPPKVRRTLGQKEDDSVIIDVSEDEGNDNTEDEVDAMDIETDDHVNLNSRPTQHGPEGIEASKQRLIRDLPPLTDFPARSKISDKLASNTPPAAQSPGKAKETEGLKTKEKEIEFMKRRIAELEQRNKAKQTFSRAQTPGTPGQPKSPPKPGETTLVEVEQSRPGVGIKPSAQSDLEHAQAHVATLQALETISKVNGRAESVEQVEMENPAMTASELSQVAKQIVLENEQECALDQPLEELESTQMDIDRSQIPQLTILEEKQQPQLPQQKAKENAGSDAMIGQVQAAEAIARDEKQQPLAVEQLAEISAVPIAKAERSRSVEETSEEEQRKRRRTELESGLPVLDAEVERTKLKLQLLRKQMEDLESEVQKGIEGRRSLMDELVSLSAAPSPTPKASSEDRQGFIDKPSTRPPEENNRDSQPVVADVHQTVPPTTEANSSTNDEMDFPASGTQIPLSPPIHDGEQTANGALAEDVMDISSSDADEGEITDYSPEPPNTVEVEGLIPESDDNYEPPLTIDPVPLTALTSHPDETVTRTSVSSSPPVELNGRQEDSEDSHDLQPSGKSSEDANEAGEISAVSRSQSAADASDSEDYEPPEPAIPVLPPVSQLHHELDSSKRASTTQDPGVSSPVQSIPSSAAPDVQDHAGATRTASTEIDAPTAVVPVSSSKMTRFTPYESPLKQFKSYRYHSDYVSEVSQGFRSLTYSHAIDPGRPICRYEVAGGICNDDSCDGQHFRSIGLSDDKVLLQIGMTPAGFSPQDSGAYVEGLRKTIQEIRRRKVKDFNEVAAEILTYRARFLGDGSKILPLGI